jgi:predicted dehydrogenase
MHLPYLAELADRFEIAGVCDLSPDVAAGCAARFGAAHVHSSWQDLLGESLDAVMILTSGDHAPMAIAAAEAGLHVFVEKPMSLSSEGAGRMVQAARAAQVRLMVGTMKRYDPAYQRLVELLADPGDMRLVRVTTLESPLDPYVAHYPLLKPEPAPQLPAEWQDAEAQALDATLGDPDDTTRWCYRWILLDNLVHELNALRGALGEPTEVVHADLSDRCVSINLRFDAIDCHLSWVDLPGIARYRQEFAFYAPTRRLTLELPSPFLRSMPGKLIVEDGTPGTTHSSRREEIVSFEEAFRRELIEFHSCILDQRDPVTSGEDGLADVRLCQAIAQRHMQRGQDVPAAGGVGGMQ